MGEQKKQLEIEAEIAFSVTWPRIKDALDSRGLLSENPSPTAPTAPEKNLRVCWDTRNLPSTGDIVFVAKKGGKFDGNTLAQEYIARGHHFIGELAAVLRCLREKGVAENDVRKLIQHPKFLGVSDSDAALKAILNQALEFSPNSFSSIAITGTSGKTSTTQIVSALWEKLAHAEILKLGTLGVQIGSVTWEGSYPTMPDYSGFLSAITAAHRKHISKIVFEATSHGLVENRLGEWQCDVAVFCNFSQDHLDFHKTMAAYRSCKGILFEKHLKPNGVAVLNTTDPEWTYFLSRTRHQTQKVIGFGYAAQKEKFFAETRRLSRTSQFLEVESATSTHTGIAGTWKIFEEQKQVAEAKFTCPLLGEFQHQNLAAAVCSLLAMNYSIQTIAPLCENLPGIPGRLDHVRETAAAPHPTVLVDYAHKPDALEKTLQTLRALTPPNGKLVCVFGCGGDRDATKRPIMGEISARIADLTYVTSDNPRTENPQKIVANIMQGISPAATATAIVDRREAIFTALREASDNDVVVIAGKGHEDYQIVGSEKFPFSDFDTAKNALIERARKKKRSE